MGLTALHIYEDDSHYIGCFYMHLKRLRATPLASDWYEICVIVFGYLVVAFG